MPRARRREVSAVTVRLPPHLEETDEARVRCKDCGAVGLRPLAHREDCEHVRETGKVVSA